MKHLLCLLTVLGLAASSAFAADVTGQWTAQVPGRQGTMDTTFTFKVEGARLTGSITTQMGDTPITDGKVSGDDISFLQILNFGQEIKIVYKGKVSGAEIKFTREREGAGNAQEFTAKKK